FFMELIQMLFHFVFRDGEHCSWATEAHGGISAIA
ncbi:Os08g0145501, partial [Oryza sativa Japonica Group]